MGLKADGSLVVWGENEYGQSTVPEPNEDFVSMAAGRDHCLALKEDRTVVGWGINLLGLSTVPEPNQDFVAVTAGYRTSMALRAYNTGLEPSQPVIENLSILSVFPNPITSSVVVKYSAPEPANMQLNVFDIAGRKVKSINIGVVPRGESFVSWDGLGESGEPLSSGIYFLYLSNDGGASVSRSVVIVR